MLDRVKNTLPTFVSEVEIPVYLIHTDAGPDDYFFLFDFMGFAEQSRKGLFVRPKLLLWAGRDDFRRDYFAAYFRQTFQAEFDRMRSGNVPSERGSGLLGRPIWASDLELFALINVGQFVLWLALLGPRAVSNVFKVGWFGRRRRAATERKIGVLQGQVDDVLRNIEVNLHPELYEHSRKMHGPVQRSRVTRDAWPLPDYVRRHLEDNKSGSWW